MAIAGLKSSTKDLTVSYRRCLLWFSILLYGPLLDTLGGTDRAEQCCQNKFDMESAQEFRSLLLSSLQCAEEDKDEFYIKLLASIKILHQLYISIGAADLHLDTMNPETFLQDGIFQFSKIFESLCPVGESKVGCNGHNEGKAS